MTLLNILTGKNAMRYLLGLLWVAFTISVVFYILIVGIDKDNTEVVYTLIGFIVGICKDVYGFSFNTSQGSSDKAETLKEVAKSNG